MTAITAICIVGLSACGGGGGSDAPTPSPVGGNPPPPPPPGAKTSFSDATAASGLTHVYAFDGVQDNDLTGIQRMAGGVAAGDINGDGLIDLYMVAGDSTPNHLFLNNGDNTFTDETASFALDLTHAGSGPTFADIDGDGDLDMFIGSAQGDRIYLLRRDGDAYVDVTDTSGLAITVANTVSAAFGDYDGDGDLDLFTSHWYINPQADTESLWQNNGDGTFTAASIPSGIAENLIVMDRVGGASPRDYTFTPVFSDIDGDADLDLVIASDFETSQVFNNNGDGTFDLTTDRGIITDRAGMGAATGDYDNDGDMDWFVTAIYRDESTVDDGNRLYRNDGNGVFADVTDEAGVREGGWGWGACMQDFDNDGDLDIFHTNGFDLGARDDEYLTDQVVYFENQGDGTFVDYATDAGLTDTGQGRGVVCFDSDRDGDLDILISNNNAGEAADKLYINNLGAENNYLTIKLEGSGLNTQGVGAWITVSGDGNTQVREIYNGNNYVSQNPAEAHFGLGETETVDIQVRWPDGTNQPLSGVAVNQFLTIVQP